MSERIKRVVESVTPPLLFELKTKSLDHTVNLNFNTKAFTTVYTNIISQVNTKKIAR